MTLEEIETQLNELKETFDRYIGAEVETLKYLFEEIHNLGEKLNELRGEHNGN